MLLRIVTLFLVTVLFSFSANANVKSFNSWHVTKQQQGCILIGYPRINNKNLDRTKHFISIYFSELNSNQLIVQIVPGITIYGGYALSLRLNTKVYELKQYRNSVWSPSADKNQEILTNMVKANDMTFRIRDNEDKTIITDRYDLKNFGDALEFLYKCNGKSG